MAVGITTSDVTTRSSAPSSSPSSATFSFLNVPTMYTCGESVVTWDYTGSNELIPVLNIYITDIGVTQSAAPSNTESQPTQTTTASSSSTSVPSIDILIASDLDPFTGSWTWDNTNVTQGWYILEASLSTLTSLVSSSNFFVFNGTDTSCFAGTGSTGSSSSSSTSSPSSSTDSSTSSASPSAVADVSSSSKHTGAIVGGVIGGLAFVCAAIAALIFFFCRRGGSRSTRARARAQSDLSPIGAWGALTTLPTRTNRSRKQSKHESPSAEVLTNKIQNNDNNNNNNNHNTVFPHHPSASLSTNDHMGNGGVGIGGDSEEDLEKFQLSTNTSSEFVHTPQLGPTPQLPYSLPLSPGAAPPFPLPISTSVPPLIPTALSKRNSSSSSVVRSSTTNSPTTHRALSTPSPVMTRDSVQSIDSVMASRQSSTNTRTRDRPTSIAHTPSSSQRTNSNRQSTEFIPLERSATSLTRRPTRKPVPRYDSADFVVDSTGNPVHHHHTSGTEAEQDGINAGSVPSPVTQGSTESMQGQGQGQQQQRQLLHHQSSFGHLKPMNNILMPDLPSPSSSSGR